MSKKLSGIQKTGGNRSAHFFPVSGDLEIGYRQRSCSSCSFLWLFSSRCSDDDFYINLKFPNGDTERFQRTPECGSSNWVVIHISTKGFRIGSKMYSFKSDRSKQSLLGATLTATSTYEMEWALITQDKLGPTQRVKTTTATTPVTSVVLGSAGAGGLILVLTTIAVICYRKKRQSLEIAPDDDKEYQDYDDAINLDEETYADAMNTVECEYDNTENIYEDYDPECVYENPENFVANVSQEGQQAKFQRSGY
ncbi:uncharacterized protein [Macrobrachium rosenbergii]|uniref:uncharacterized protein isoform X2 n=1 Tax=Macrobrachium rosenbergii TaxID=79674 RepID=UPI0034D3CCDA